MGQWSESARVEYSGETVYDWNLFINIVRWCKYPVHPGGNLKMVVLRNQSEKSVSDQFFLTICHLTVFSHQRQTFLKLEIFETLIKFWSLDGYSDWSTLVVHWDHGLCKVFQLWWRNSSCWSVVHSVCETGIWLLQHWVGICLHHQATQNYLNHVLIKYFSFQISGPATTQTGARADSCTTDYLIINGATNTPTSNPRYDRWDRVQV